jgi:hypothetical protein
MSERGVFWVCYVLAALGVMAYLLACASGWTPADVERHECRVFAENTCGRDGGSSPCRQRAYLECAALKRKMVERCQGGEF